MLALASHAEAQDALLLGGKYLSASRNFGEVLGPAPVVAGPQIFAGGRFAAIPTDPDLRPVVVVFDGGTGREVYRTTVSALVALDRARPRLFEQRTTGIVAVSMPDGAVSVVSPRTDLAFCAYAYAADQLVCGAARGDGRTDIVVLTVRSGQQRVAATTDALLRYGWVVTPDGSRAYYSVPGGSDALDLATGAVVGTTGILGGFFYDESRQRLLHAGGGFNTPPTLEVFDTDLRPLGTVPSPIALVSVLRAVEVSPHTGRLYLYAWNSNRLLGDAETLAVLDGDTYDTLGSISTDTVYRDKSGEFAVLTAPGPPRDLRAVVSGHDVALEWINVGAAGHFVLEVGLAPGRTDLSTYLGPDGRASFTGVPSGTYYVRLRGGNAFGGGRASSEVRVIVP